MRYIFLSNFSSVFVHRAVDVTIQLDTRVDVITDFFIIFINDSSCDLCSQNYESERENK